MFDCGIPFKKMKDDLYKVDALLITHCHSDHIHPPTLKAIKEQFPRIRIFANAHVAYQFDEIDKVIGTAPFELLGGRTVIPFDCSHDVPCTGYILQQDGLTIIYATDTNRIEPPEGYQYDYVFLESNYDEVKLRQEAKKYKRNGYDPGVSSLRHLSTQKCKEFYFLNRKDKNSQLIELHKSTRFY